MPYVVDMTLLVLVVCGHDEGVGVPGVGAAGLGACEGATDRRPAFERPAVAG
jgi:hypothetical protein